MYLMRPDEREPKHPVSRLFEDLLEARKRDVEVTIYLNTKFKGRDPKKVAEGPWFDRLRAAGAVIHLVSPVRRLHDKLVIVDRRFVVEGSMNWSVSAIEDNFESSTLIGSPELAESKLRRIGFFPIWGEEKTLAAQPEILFPAGPPTSIEIPAALIEEQKYFPRMITTQRSRAIKFFLLLLFISEAKGTRRFQISLEAMANFLEVPQGETREAVRRQAIRVLRSLASTEKLLRAEFRHGKEAEVELLLPKGPTFAVGSHDLGVGELAVLSDNDIFLRLIRARLRSEEKRLEDFSQAEIARRFFLNRKTYSRTLAGVEK